MEKKIRLRDQEFKIEYKKVKSPFLSDRLIHVQDNIDLYKNDSKFCTEFNKEGLHLINGNYLRKKGLHSDLTVVSKYA